MSLNMWVGHELEALLAFLDTVRDYDVLLLQECTSCEYGSDLVIADWDMPCRPNLL